MPEPLVFQLRDRYGHDPFLILISCLLSLRAKDLVTWPICKELFAIAKTPEELLAIPQEHLSRMIYSIGFYRRKAEILHSVCQDLLDRFDGKVPRSKKALLSITGVGIKTANLVLGEGFGIPAICVDTHVHRLSNLFGLVNTETPEETEKALEQIVPKEYWIELNRLLVKWGQNTCLPRAKECRRCPVKNLCKEVYQELIG